MTREQAAELLAWMVEESHSRPSAFVMGYATLREVCDVAQDVHGLSWGVVAPSTEIRVCGVPVVVIEGIPPGEVVVSREPEDPWASIGVSGLFTASGTWTVPSTSTVYFTGNATAAATHAATSWSSSSWSAPSSQAVTSISLVPDPGPKRRGSR